MDSFSSLLPTANGYLPYYLLITSIIAVGNSLQNYLTLHFSRRFYNGQFSPNRSLPPKTSTYDPADARDKLVPVVVSEPGGASKKDDDDHHHATPADQVTPLAARLFGTYTVVSAIVRLYASYYLHLQPVYQMAVWTYVVALAHFGSEFLVYKTTRAGVPQALPFFFATLGISWMLSQYGFYVERA